MNEDCRIEAPDATSTTYDRSSTSGIVATHVREFFEVDNICEVSSSRRTTIVVKVGSTELYLPEPVAQAIADYLDSQARQRYQAEQCAQAGCNGDHSTAAVQAGTNLDANPNIIRSVN